VVRSLWRSLAILKVCQRRADRAPGSSRMPSAGPCPRGARLPAREPIGACRAHLTADEYRYVNIIYPRHVDRRVPYTARPEASMSASNAWAKTFRRGLRLASHVVMILAIAISIAFIVVRFARSNAAPATTRTIGSDH
jgi:hypothetical protein